MKQLINFSHPFHPQAIYYVLFACILPSLNELEHSTLFLPLIQDHILKGRSNPDLFLDQVPKANKIPSNYLVSMNWK